MVQAAKKVLVIDDEAEVRDIYQREFGRQGYNVDVADDGEEGLLKAGENQPDLILLDIMLPKMSGLDVLKSLKGNSLTKEIPVLLLTNLADDRIIKDGFKTGAEGYLLKASYTPSQIVEESKKYFK